MGGNTYGKIFRVTTWGESHGKAVGVVVDGVPAGFPLKEEDIQHELDRRSPGKFVVSTPRQEGDEIQILSGIFKGRTTGMPISMLIQNIDVESTPYEAIKSKPRPGHADLTYRLKYGHVDYRGGGRSSGRETAGRVAGGAIAKKILRERDIEILGHTIEAAGIRVSDEVSPKMIRKNAEKNPMRCADPEIAKKMEKEVLKTKEEGDSTGGVVEVLALNVPAGLGDPVFDKLDAEISKALMSIGAVKGVEIGLGFDVTGRRGSEVIDEFEVKEGKIVSRTNRAGGVLGGISTGEPIVARLAVKPPSSISKPVKTVDLETKEETEIELRGRFDPNICPRIVPVAESMLALVVVDQMLRAGVLSPNRIGGTD